MLPHRRWVLMLDCRHDRRLLRHRDHDVLLLLLHIRMLLLLLLGVHRHRRSCTMSMRNTSKCASTRHCLEMKPLRAAGTTRACTGTTETVWSLLLSWSLWKSGGMLDILRKDIRTGIRNGFC